MKKLTFILLLLTITILTSCANSKTINGIEYRPYGIFNEQHKNPDIYYEISGHAALSGILFVELALIPTIYTYGYNLWEPVCSMEEYHKTRKNAGIK